MKTIKDILENLGSDSIIAIGAGNSFVYIGKANDTEMIEKCFEDYLAKAMLQRSDYEKRLHNLVMKPPQLEPNSELEEQLKIIHARANSISSTLNALKQKQEYIDTYKPIWEREVKESYYKAVDDCTAIIVKGLEQGDFWFKHEFDSRYKKKDV